MTASLGPPRTPVQRRVLYVAIVASFMAFLDGSVVNLALPALGRELGGGWWSNNGWWTRTC
ncbi:drug resistance transporter, EmrB/QacA protein [Arthrobacter sp. Hiyo6]|nr:drug resistance transporter, EmrB/QacA protein [Arthrobacter sp. Hiyo6]